MLDIILIKWPIIKYIISSTGSQYAKISLNILRNTIDVKRLESILSFV